jgi:hypothetical protein
VRGKTALPRPEVEAKFQLDILHFLYKHFNDNPEGLGVDRAIIQATFDISESDMEDYVRALQEKNFVTLTKRSYSPKWIFVKIAEEGVLAIENGQLETDNMALPDAEEPELAPLDNGYTDYPRPSKQFGYPPSRSYPSSQLSYNEQLKSAFEQAYDQVRVTPLSGSDMAKTIKQLKNFEILLQRPKPADLPEIRKTWEWVKKKVVCVTPMLQPVVLEGIKQTLEI